MRVWPEHQLLLRRVAGRRWPTGEPATRSDEADRTTRSIKLLSHVILQYGGLYVCVCVCGCVGGCGLREGGQQSNYNETKSKGVERKTCVRTCDCEGQTSVLPELPCSTCGLWTVVGG